MRGLSGQHDDDALRAVLEDTRLRMLEPVIDAEPVFCLMVWSSSSISKMKHCMALGFAVRSCGCRKRTGLGSCLRRRPHWTLVHP